MYTGLVRLLFYKIRGSDFQENRHSWKVGFLFFFFFFFFGLNNIDLSFHSSGAWKSKTKTLSGLFSPEGPLWLKGHFLTVSACDLSSGHTHPRCHFFFL